MESDIYSDYEIWKGWDNLFTCSKEKAIYFSGETRGLSIADSDIFEIGFGSGDFVRWACDRGARVVGTEINPRLCEAALQYGISVVDADLTKISNEYFGKFDSVVAFDVFEHLSLEELQTYLRAAEKLLKNGGHLIMRFPNGQSPFGLVKQHGDPTHRSYLSRAVIERLVQGGRLTTARYGHEFRVLGRTPFAFITRLLRNAVKDLISIGLNAVYSTKIPYDAVVVLVLKKQGP